MIKYYDLEIPIRKFEARGLTDWRVIASTAATSRNRAIKNFRKDEGHNRLMNDRIGHWRVREQGEN
jgi:hypothetical protein